MEKKVGIHLEDRTNLRVADRLKFLLDHHPVQQKERIAWEIKKRKILIDLLEFQESKKEDGLAVFKSCLFDTGLASSVKIKEEDRNRILKIDPEFIQDTAEPIFIYNRQTILQVTTDGILKDKEVAFLHFDIKNLRAADQAGYAEFLLRDLAKILLEVAEKNKDLGLIPARIGGDEFCFLFVASDDKKSLPNLEQYAKVYNEVAQVFSQKIGYFMTDDDTATIEKRTANLKSTFSEANVVIANNKKKREKLLARVISSGRVPNQVNILKEGINVTGAEIQTKKTKVINRYQYEPKDQLGLEGAIKGFVKSHPEFSNEISKINDLIILNKLDLANYLFYLTKQYLIDPLLSRESHTLPGFINHLKARNKKDKNEHVEQIYFPWLKNLNTEFGESRVDELIIRPLGEEANNYRKGSQDYIDGRQGADFFLVSTEYPKNEVAFLTLDESTPAHPIFGRKIPYFLIATNYPEKTADIKQVIDDMKYMGSMALVKWFDQLFIENPEQAKKALDWYLEERTEDRCKAFLRLLKTFEQPQLLNVESRKIFIDKLENLLKDK